MRQHERSYWVDIWDDADGPSPHKREFMDKDREYVVLEVAAYVDGALVESLGDIDFFEDGDDWVRGKFFRVSEIPNECEHLRQIARDMNLPE